MPSGFLEHVNLTVLDVDRAVHFIQTAMPDFEIRGGGVGVKCKRWVHIGTADSYLAIEDRGAVEKGPHEPYVHPGLNHLGFVVDSVEQVGERLRAAGFTEGLSELTHPYRKRLYFYDDDGNEYEFVEYLSEIQTERNDYSS